MTTLQERPASAETVPAPLLPDVTPAVIPTVEARPRILQGRTQDDVNCLIGSAIGSLALVALVYGGLLPFSGVFGFVVLWFLAFALFYAAVTAVTNPGTVVRDRLASTLITAGAAATGLGLASAIVYTVARGSGALVHLNTFTSDGAGVGPLTPITKGGVDHAILGSLIEITIAVAFALPLGVGTAIYMTEVGGKLARVVRTIVEAMTALPSIVAALFIYTVWIIGFGGFHHQRSGFAGSLAIFVMILPIIARASDVVLRVVPSGLREASLALGASRWQTVRRVVLPTARPGLATALILGIARGIGETSPVLLTSGASTFLNVNPLKNPMNSLPLYIYSSVRSGQNTLISRGFGAATILLIIVLVLFVLARFFARQRVGNR